MVFGAVVCMLLASLAAAQPVVGRVTTETIFAGQDLPENRVVQGSVFRVDGLRLAAGEHAASGFPLATSLGGTSIRVVSGGGTFDAILLSTDGNFVRAVLPSKTPVGDALLILTGNGSESAPFKIRVAKRDFGLYGLVQNYDEAGGVQQNSFEHPARAGQLIGLWGTGLGAVDGDEALGPLPAAFTIPGLDVLVGDVPAKVVYAGRSGCCAGVDQVIFEAPVGIEGCNVAVKVRYPVGDTAGAPKTDFGSVSLVLAGAATDCSQYSRTVRYGTISLTNATNLGGGGVATFYNGGPVLLPATGTCGADRLAGRLSYLAAGAAIRLTTPQGPVVFSHPPGFPPLSEYFSPFPIPVWAPGSYTLDNGEGGTDLKAFQLAFSLPDIRFSWTNQDSLVIRPDDGLRITWDGGVPGGYVVISGRFSIEGYEGATEIQGGFSCVERVEKGNFVVPAADMWTSLTRAADYLLQLDVIHVYKQVIDVPGLDLAEFIYNLDAKKTIKLR